MYFTTILVREYLILGKFLLLFYKALFPFAAIFYKSYRFHMISSTFSAPCGAFIKKNQKYLFSLQMWLNMSDIVV